MFEQKSLFSIYRAFLKILFIVLICMPIAHWDAPLCSKYSDGKAPLEKVKAEVITQKIKQFYLNNQEAQKISIYKYPLACGSIIRPAFSSTDGSKSKENEILICKESATLFVVDYHPHAHFEHRVDIGIINNCNQDNPEIIKSVWWPEINGEPVFLGSDKWEQIEDLPNRKEYDSRMCDDNISSRPCNDTPQRSIIGKPKNTRRFWAIIICGFYEEKDSDKSLSYAANDMYSTLSLYGVPHCNIFYITPNRPGLENDRNIDSNSVSISTISEYFSLIARKIHPHDKFLFFINTHGGINTLSLSNDGHYREILCSSLLNDMLNKIRCRRQFVIISSCNSGSFVSSKYPSIDISNSLGENSKRVVITSGDSSDITYKDIDDKNPGDICDPNPGDRGSEFVGGFIGAFTNSNSDILNLDDRISISEAFLYARKNAFCGDLTDTKCPIRPAFSPKLKCSKGINPLKEFLFWD